MKKFKKKSKINSFQDLPEILFLYEIFEKSKKILELLKPSKVIQLYGNEKIGKRIIESLSLIYFNCEKEFSSPKFGYSNWKITMLKRHSQLSSSFQNNYLSKYHSQFNQNSFFSFNFSFKDFFYNIVLYFIIFINFVKSVFGFDNRDFVERNNEFFEEGRILERDFNVELFKDSFKINIIKIGSLWNFDENYVNEIIKNSEQKFNNLKGNFFTFLIF